MWVVVGLAAAIATAVVYFTSRKGDVGVPADVPEERDASELVARSKPSAAPEPVSDPFAAPVGPLSTEDALGGLKSRLEAKRLRALEEIVRRGAVSDPEILAILEQMAEGPEGRVRAWAQGALMKVEGSRRFLRELAVHAAAAPLADFYADLVKLIDPSTGPGLLAATTAAQERAQKPELHPVPGLDEAITALASDPAAGAEPISAAARAGGTDEPVWLDIAAAMKPVPLGVSSLMAERYTTGTPSEREAAVSFLVRNGLSVSKAPPDLVPALSRRLGDRDDPLRGAAIRALGRLPAVDAETIDAIVRAAKDSEQRSYDALIALRNLGPQARPAVRSIIALSPSLSPSGQFLLAQALLAIGGDGVGQYAAERIATADPTERGEWLAGAHALAMTP